MSQADPMAFLGEEFLTWLWFRIETEGGEFDLGRGLQIGVSFYDLIAFAPSADDATEQTLKNGLPSRSPEAAAALRRGRRLSRARLVIAQGEQEWSVVVDGPSMNLLGIKLPEDDPELSDTDERSLERIQGFLVLRAHVSALYATFLAQRLAPRYLENEAAAQATWMATR